MADKVLRFTADDSGYGQTIDRMAAKLRTAFSGTGMEDILSEADAKFTKFSDKIRFVHGELKTIKEANRGEFADRLAQIDNMKDTGAQKLRLATNEDRRYTEEQKSIEKLIEALNHFTEKVSDKAEIVERENPDQSDLVDRIDDKLRPGGGGGKGTGKGGGGGSDEGSGGGSIWGTALGVALGEGIAVLVGKIGDAIKKGNEISRTELKVSRQFDLDDTSKQQENGEFISRLGMSRQEYVESLGATAASRRSAYDIGQETVNRATLSGAYDIQQDQYAGLDRFFRFRQGESGLLDKSQFDASRTITEILVRADKQGILGVNKADFTLLPEKIAQVTSIMNQQYSHADRTDANAAINTMLAGQTIGGRFADDRAADTFGKLNEGITNARTPGMRAFVLEALRRANPGKSPLELEAQLQNGIYDPSNMQAILPAIQGIRSRELRGRFYQGLGLDAQSALHLADHGGALLKSAGAAASTPAELLAAQEKTTKRAADRVTGLDQDLQSVENSINRLAQALSNGASNILKAADRLAPSESISGQGLKTNKVIPASPVGGK